MFVVAAVPSLRQSGKERVTRDKEGGLELEAFSAGAKIEIVSVLVFFSRLTENRFVFLPPDGVRSIFFFLRKEGAHRRRWQLAS